MYKYILSFVLLIFFGDVSSQTPTVTPDFFAPDEEITITYDVTSSSLSNLNEAWIWMWNPDISNGDAPSNINPASSNTSLTEPAKFTKTTNQGKTYFTITLTPTTFMGQTVDQLKNIGMLLKGNDWADGQTSDYVISIEGGFQLQVTSPASEFTFYEAEEEILIRASTSENATFELTVDGELISRASDTKVFAENLIAQNDGLIHDLVLTADNGSEVRTFEHSYTISPTTPKRSIPNGLSNGANYISADSLILVFTAPTKDNIYVLGDFNNWEISPDFLMFRDSSRFWLPIGQLTSGKEYTYQYLIDGELQLADPYTEKVISSFDDPEIRAENRYPDLIDFPENGYQEVSVLQTIKPSFNWTDQGFVKPKPEDLVIYELLVRDFTDERTYKAVIEKLDYLDSLGINALQLMPINEFEGNISWGYNPSFKLAVDKYYGTELDLKTLINEAHSRGMAVILDMVLNHHFGRSPLVKIEASGDFGPPNENNPWFNVNAKHPFNVGYDFNHESLYTQEYLDHVTTFWVNEYHFDGYRFDLSKGFTQRNNPNDVGAWSAYDASRIALLKRMADVIWENDATTYVMLEHLSENQEEKELADYGMMLWGNMNHTYRNLAKGSTTDIAWIYHKSRGWDKQGVIGYMESHDEERVMWDLGRTSIREFDYQINRLKLNAAFFFLVPGPKMIWQFGEFGYDEELNNDRLGIKPTRWDYLDNPERARLFATYQALINLKTKTEYINDEGFSWQPAGSFKWIHLNNEDVKISVVGNFGRDTDSGDPNFIEAGIWYDYLTGEVVNVTDPNAEITLESGEFHIFTSEPLDNYTNVVPIVLQADETEVQTPLEIYPNPTTHGVWLSPEKRGAVRVFDMSGNMVKSRSESDWDNYLTLKDLESGVYIIQLFTDDEVFSRRVLKN